MFLTVEHYVSESFLISIFTLFVSFSSRCFEIANQSLCSFRFTRLRLLCVSVVLTLATSVSIDTRLNLVLYLCNVFLFDLNLQGLLH